MQEEDKLVKLINRGLILGRSSEDLAAEIISKFSNIPGQDIIALINAINYAIEKKSCVPLTNDDLMHAEKIVLNLLNKDPDAKVSEVLKDIKVALSIKTYDKEIELLLEKFRKNYYVDFESLGIDSRFKPRRKDGYILDYDDKKGTFSISAPQNSSATGYIHGYSPNKLYFVGYKDGVIKQDYTRNVYSAKILYAALPGGKIIKKLDNKILSKGVPIEEISDSLAAEIIKRFSNESQNIFLGASVSGKNARLLNGQVQLEKIPLKEILNDLQARILITGRTGDGKTLFANLLQRQMMKNKDYLLGGVVSITRDVDNLSNAGSEFKIFYPNWDEDEKISKQFSQSVDLNEDQDFKKVIISGDTFLPDINRLSKETIFSMITNSDCSEQVKVALKRHVEEAEDIVSIFKQAKEGNLLGDEYTSAQEDALRRLMNTLIPVNYNSVEKIDIKKTLEESKNVGFFIKGLNSDVYGTMIVHELYNIQKNKGIRNPLKEGRLLMIDEVQKYIRFPAFKEIYEMCVLDGRGFGIMMLGIIQSQEQATRLCSYKDFVLYSTSTLEDGKKIINIGEKMAIIPPLAPGES